MHEKKVSDLQTVDYPFWLLPDSDHLRSLLRYVFTHKKKARERGMLAGNDLRSIHHWETAASIAEQRIRTLIGGLQKHTAPEDALLQRNERIDHAISLLQTGAYEEATDAFQKILLRYGENSLAYEGLAIAAFYHKNYDEACNLFAAANRISTDSIDIIVNWYEAAKLTGTTSQLAVPVQRALQFHCDDDELRAIAVDLNIL
ncbi:MAG: hypothetical protein JW863_00085 [Chitinispirillaceae bacterium]|nr:hypothetical protein [Chitinispirillaceae bacterium]